MGNANCLYGNYLNNTCTCFEGYDHDRVMARYTNCAVPPFAIQVITGLLMAEFSLSILYCSKNAFSAPPKSFSREISTLGTASCICLLISTSILSQDPKKESPWYAALFTCLSTSLFARMGGAMICSSLRPVLKFSRRATAAKRFEVIVLWIVPFSLVIFSLVTVLVGHSLGDDKSISDAVGVCFIFCGLAAGIEIPLIIVFMGTLLDALGKLIHAQDTNGKDNNPSDRPYFSTDIKKFRLRVSMLRKVTVCLAFTMFIVGIIAGMVQLAIGVIPLDYLLYFGIIATMAFLCVFISYHSASPEKKKQKLPLGHRYLSSEINDRSDQADFSLSQQGPKLKTILEASETSRWSQI